MDLQDFYTKFLASNGICTDTRKLNKNDFFVALKGGNFNGNLFAQKAISLGAAIAVVDDKALANHENNIYYVNDGLEFLQKLANYHRKQLNIPILALTGSNGKTTTKELIFTALATKYKVRFTIGNLNNHIGVPLTLLSIQKDDEIAIVEMGANHQKEIELLCAIAEPDFGYITNFGKAHLEGFGGFEGVVKGKSEMYDYLRKHQKKVFLNIDDALQKEKAKNIDCITFSFEQNSADYHFNTIQDSAFAAIAYKDTPLQSNLAGSYNTTNIAAAATIAMHFEVPISSIQKALQDYKPTLNRSQVVEKNGKKILLDAYNANPSSMEAALNNFAKGAENKAIILGDMFELGNEAFKEHQHIADLATENNFAEIYLIGSIFNQVKPSKKVHQFKEKSDFIHFLETNPIAANEILIKGSRGMVLENLLDSI